MPFDSESLAKARTQGYTDDQIYDHLSQSDERFRVAKQNGYSLDDVASHLTQKGGEQTNEQSKPQANSDRNAERGAVQQVNAPSQGGPQPSQEPTDGNQQVSQRDINASESQPQKQNEALLTAGQTRGGEKIEEDAKTESQRTKEGKEDGQGIRGQDDARKQAQVKDKKGGVQSPVQGLLEKTGEALYTGYKGLGTAASELQRFGWDLSKGINPAVWAGKEAEMAFGPNVFSEKIKEKTKEGDKYFADLVAGSQMTPQEAQSPVNQMTFGVGHMIGDLVEAAGTEGVTAEAKALNAVSELPIWKTIAEKSIHGIKAFAVPSLIAANESIEKNKSEGKSDADSLGEGLKTMLETEAGAALPMQVSSGLNTIIKRAASKILQSAPLAVAQNEIAGVAKNIFSKDKERTPTISENIVSGNFEEAEKQLLQAAPMSLMGIMGEKNIASETRKAGLPATATAVEKNAIKSSEDYHYNLFKQYEDIKKPDPKIEDRIKFIEELVRNGKRDDASGAIGDLYSEITGHENPQHEYHVSGEDFENRQKRLSILNSLIDNMSNLKQPTAVYLSAQQQDKDETEKQIKGPSGIPTEQVQPTIEAPAVKAEEGTPQREGEGKKEVKPQGTRVVAAAFRPDPNGPIYTGANHEEAMQSAGYEPIKEPSEREREEFGFVDEHGNWMTREEGGELAKKSGQYQKVTDRPVPHSIDIDLDVTNKPQVTREQASLVKGMADQARQNIQNFGPGAANAKEFEQSRTAIGASHILEGKTNRADWDAAMAEEGYNEETMSRPELNKLWRDSKNFVNDFEESQVGGKIRPKSAIKINIEGKPAVAKTIDALQEQISNSISKAQAFSEYLRGMAKGSKIGAEAATKEVTGNAKTAMKWHDADKNSIKDAVNTLLYKTIPDSGLRIRPNDLKNFSTNLQRILTTPFNWRGGRMVDGKFVSTNEMMWQKANALMEGIKSAANDAYSTDLRGEIRSLHDDILKSSSVSPEAKQALRDKFSGVSIRRLSPKREAILRESLAQGKEISSFAHQQLEDLSKTNLKELSVEELEALRDSAEELKNLGKEQWSNRQEAREQRMNSKLVTLNSDKSVKPNEPLEKIIRDEGSGTWEKVKDTLWNSTASSLNWTSVHEKARMFIPRMFQVLDGREGGWLDKNVYKPVLTAARNYRRELNEVKDKALEIKDKYDLKDSDFYKIFLHSHLMQGGEESELFKYSHDPKKLQSSLNEYKENGLNEGQKELYNYMRSSFDDNIGDMKQFFAEHYNKELKFYDNYFPRSIDQRKAAAWREGRGKKINEVSGKEIDQDNVADIVAHTIEQQPKSRFITKGFSKARKEGAEIPLNTNAMDVFFKHMDDWFYVKHVQPVLNEVGKMATSNIFEDKYGKVGKGLVLDYVDALAKKGQYAKRGYEQALDFVKNKAMVGLLGFRLGQFKHLANYPIGMEAAGGGGWWAKGIMASHTIEGKEFIQRVWPEIYERSGGDVSILEATKGKGLTSKSFVIDRVLDYNNAKGVALGKYMKALSDMGYDWKDFHKIPVNEDLVNESAKAVVNAVGSPLLEDRPLIVTKGTSIGSKSVGSALMAYQSPKMVRWGMLRNAISDDIMQQKAYGKAAKKLTLLGASSLIEASVKYGSKAAYTAGAGAILSMLGFKIYQRKHEEDEAKKIALEAVSDLSSTVPFGSIGSKLIQSGEYPQARQAIFSQTDVPPLDMTIGMTASALGFAFDHDKKSAFKLAQSLLEVSGLPVAPVVDLAKAGVPLLDKAGQARKDILERKKELGKTRKKKK